MSSHTSSLFDVWSRSAARAVDAAIDANRALASALGATPLDESDADSEADDTDGSDDAAALEAGTDLPDWDAEVDASEDLEVDDTVRFSKTLDEADVERFALASGDTNPVHLDEEWAAKTRFGGRIVHGTLVAGVVSAALARLPGGVIYLSQDTEFQAPVHLGDRVTATVEVVEDLGGDRYRLRTQVHDGDTLAVDGEAVVLVEDVPE